MAVVPYQTVKKTPALRQRIFAALCAAAFFSSESVSDKELQPSGGGTLPKG